MLAARAAGITGVLIGDAGHDGGIDRAAPDMHFATAGALAAHPTRLPETAAMLS